LTALITAIAGLVGALVALNGGEGQPVDPEIHDKAAPKPSLLGRWIDSTHGCDVIVTKDDGKNIEAHCGSEVVNHNLKGAYAVGADSNPTVSVFVMRDNRITNCQTTTHGTIQVVDDNHLAFSQDGWNGCDAHIPPSVIHLTRASQ
jgi:hypothetical protein